jgi:hypothetical protein
MPEARTALLQQTNVAVNETEGAKRRQKGEPNYSSNAIKKEDAPPPV